MTLRTVLLSLQALLAAAEPDDPQDAVVAKQYKESPDVFRRTALYWASVYAGGKFAFILSKYSPSPETISLCVFTHGQFWPEGIVVACVSVWSNLDKRCKTP